MTLRSRLLVGLVALLLTFGVAGWVVARNQRSYLMDQVDRQLEGATPVVFGLADGGPRPTGVGSDGLVGGRRFLPTTDSPFSELYVGRLSADGTLESAVSGGLLQGSPDLSGLDVSSLPASSPDPRTAGAPGVLEVDPFTVDGDGTSSRFRVRIIGRRDLSGWLVVALPLNRVDAAVDRLLLALGGAALGILAVAGLAVWWVVRLGLRPIKQMTVAADAVAAGASGHRVEFDDERTEAGRLGRAFNVMLDEREQAEDRLRRFVADASHELRTPVTSIRGYVDLYQAHGLDDPARLDDAMRRMGQEARRMGGLVEDLLLLANLDQGRPLARDPVDIGEILNDAAADALAMQPTRPIALDAPGPGELVVTGDEPRLRQVVGALVHNAVVHTPASAGLRLAASSRAEGTVIEVADQGPGMTADEAAHAFERFVRGDPSRSRHHGGSGLGLSIATSIVEAHGGRIALDTAAGAGCRFTIVLPMTAASSEASTSP